MLGHGFLMVVLNQTNENILFLVASLYSLKLLLPRLINKNHIIFKSLYR